MNSHVYALLVRHFFNRLFDNELVSSSGNLRESVATVLGLLGASSLPVAWVTVEKHWLMNVRTPAHIRAAVEWSDREFLISMSMAIVAAVAIFCWESVFPDRTDSIILTSFPIRPSFILSAKLATLGAVLLATTTAANFTTTFFFPIATMQSGSTGEAFRLYAAHIVAIGSASAFVFLTMLALQGLLANVMPYRLFQQISAWVQLLSLFGVLFLFFVIPPIASISALTHPANRTTALILPPFWFLGLYQQILGTNHPFVLELSSMALRGLAISGLAAGVLYALAYRRLMRRTIEEAGSVGTSDSRRWRKFSEWIDRIWLGRASERAAFHFVWRTMTRNRGHRLILAAYAAVGLVYIVDGIASLVKKTGGHALTRPNTALSAFALVLPFFVLLGLRALFSLPVELKANWLWRLTDPGRPDEYVRGARKLMLAAAIVPVSIISLPLYGMLWGWTIAVPHVLMSFLISMTALELLMAGFRKLPFTCAFMPGKGNLKVKFGAYVVLFLSLAFLLINIELWLASNPRRAVVGIIITTSALAFAVRRRHLGEHARMGILWEEPPIWHMQTLELSR